jgi:hypothetical protein
VFWVHANNSARLEQGFRDIADQLKLPGLEEPQADVFKLVHNWLRDENHGKWLLVLDGLDNAAVLYLRNDQKARDDIIDYTFKQYLLSYLPSSKHGSILITSRTKQVVSLLVEDGEMVVVGPMHNADAQALLEKKLGDNVKKDGIFELASALDHMPLALMQAAAYIRRRGPRYSVRQYLEKFCRDDKKKASLLGYKTGHVSRHEEVRNSIILTWQISLNHIQGTNQPAIDLLSLMSFFDRHSIPVALLYGYSCEQTRYNSFRFDRENGEQNDECDEISDTSDGGLEEDILILLEYSFISFSADPETFEMHSLVQLCIQKWLENQGQLERWKQRYIWNLCAAFPEGRYENWTKCRMLYMHALLARTQKPKNADYLEKWALLLYNAASYAWQIGSASEAEEMALQSMRARQELFGIESLETISSMAMLGRAKNLKGEWKEAEQLFKQVMQVSIRILGEEHTSTLASVADLALTYQKQGRWEEAEELGVRVLEVRKTVLGLGHPDTLTSIADLASTYRNQGRLDEAEELEVRLVDIRQRVLGDEHPDTLTSIHNLALAYASQGRWEQAEELEVKVIETRKRVLGDEHPDTLTSMADLASTYRNQGRWEEAKKLEVEVIDMRKRVLGDEHPDTLTSIHNLASTNRNQGLREETKEPEVQANKTSMYKNQNRLKGTMELDVHMADMRLTPLQRAAKNGHELVVKLLLEAGKFYKDAEDRHGRTPLSWAAEMGHEAVVRLLLETGKDDTGTADEHQRTPLSLAAEQGHEAIVKMLLETGKVDPNTKDNCGRTPLHMAADKGHEAIVKMLIETGKADPNAGDIYGRTPLLMAAEKGHEAIAKIPLKTGEADLTLQMSTSAA